MARRWRRKLFRGGLIAVALVAVAAAALPYWWPAVVRLLPGVSIGDSDTQGWTAIELHDVTYQRAGVRVTVNSVRLPAFGWWPASGEGPMVAAKKVTVESLPVADRVAPPPAAHRLVAAVLRVWPDLARWLPAAQIDELEIVPASGGTSRQFRQVRWDGARLSIASTVPGRIGTVTATVERLDDQTLRLAAAADEAGLALDARARWQEQQLDLTADLTWRANTAAITAVFGPGGLIPTRAAIAAPTLSFGAAEFSVPGYGAIDGAVQAEWTGDGYTATVSARAAPIDPKADLPPIAIDVRAAGDLAQVRVQSATVHVPGVDATLSAPLVLALPSGTPAAPADFSVEIDLTKLPRAAAQGRASGRVNVTGGPGVAPAAQFSLRGEGIRWREGAIPTLAVEGQWTPTELAIEKMDVRLAGESHIEAAAKIDLTQKIVQSAHVTARLAAAAIRPWWPASPEFAELSVEAGAEGPWSNPAHSGRVAWQGLTGIPGALDGEFTWQGEGATTITLEGTMVAGGVVTLPVAVSVARDGSDSVRAELTKLAWQDAAGEWWHLAGAAPLRFGPGGLAVEKLQLSGDTISLTADADIRWPSSGRITLNAANVAAARLGSLLPEVAKPASLEALDVRATWDQGPVQLAGSLRVGFAADQDAYYSVQAEFRTEAEDLAFGAVRIYDGSGAVLQGEARLPLALLGQADGFRTSLPRDGALMLKLTSTPNPEFWASITRLTNWQVAGPEVSAELSGTLGSPSGRIEFAAASVQLPPGFAGTMQLPNVGDVKFVVGAEADGLALTEGIFTLDGNWVSLQGRAPWSLWREARAQHLVPWRGAEFSFSADRMPMTVASRAVPTVFAPDGDVSFSLRHAPDRGFTGFLILANAALRALPPIGSLRDIAGRVEIDGYAARLPELGALLGGRPINISGEADIAQADHPVFDLHLTSARVPLVRQQGLVLRAGLDLRVAQTADHPAHIAGSVDLGQSVFVSDLVSLLPTGGSVATPEQRPPYFSVRGAPFADWTLDVALRGEEFLRIEHPFFKGTLSVEGQLRGTLAEPRAIGRAWTTRGTITFPFGSMRVDQFEASLSERNPFEPVLLGNATTRVYGYDVRLAVSGTAAEPRLLFSSDPPLTSQAVFLMLSAGEMPDTGHVFTSNARAQRLAMFVGRNLVTTFGLGGEIGGEDRLVVRSGEDFSREGGETIYVQYNLGNRWSVVAEKDRFDAVNGGIKFRVIDR